MKTSSYKFRNLFPETTTANAWKATVIFVAGLILTFTLTIHLKNDVEKEAKTEYVKVCIEIKEKISERLRAHAQLLRTGSAFFETSDTVTRQIWRKFNEKTGISIDLPGIQGVGYAMLIPKNQLQQHIQSIRKEGFPDYTVKPAGERDPYTSIVFLEPFNSRNLRAYGYDMFSEPVRRKAMELARDSGMVALSGKVILIQESGMDIQAGSLMYMPVYRNGLPANTVGQRRSTIKGWVYSPCRMNDLMVGILGSQGSDISDKIHLQVYDDSISATSLLYDSKKTEHIISANDPALTLTFPVHFLGKNWVFYFSNSAEEASMLQGKVLIVLIGGCIISFLLFSLFLTVFNTLYRANHIAAQLTSELTESEEKYRDFVNHIPDIIYKTSDKRGGLFWSENVKDILGFSPEEIKDNPFLWLESIHPDDKPNVYKAIEDFDKGEKYDIEYRIKTRSGKWIWLHDHFIFRKQNGDELIIEGHASDITSRKEAEQALNESKEKFRLLIQNSNDILVQINENGEQFFISDAVERITGYTAEELKGPISAVVHPEDIAVLSQQWQDILTNKNEQFRLQYRHKHKEKGYVWFEAVTQNYFEHPAIHAVVANIRDISANKESELNLIESELKLKELNATKDRFFSIIAHDLKTPFNSVIGFSNLLIENIRAKDYEGIERYAGIIKNSSERAMDLLMNLMDWSRSQTGRMNFHPEPVEIDALINQVTELTNDAAFQKSITVAKEVPLNTSVFADKAMVSTILRNLVSNAIKFTNQDGVILISVKITGNDLAIAVTDNGIGISKENLGKLFRLDETYSTNGTKNEKGTGLGLILCKEFVEKHGGTIGVESTEGKGSRFFLTLPAAHSTVKSTEVR